MPPYASGLLTPSRPSRPAFLNTSCAGNAPSRSHASTCGLISFSTNSRTVRRSCWCSSVSRIGAEGIPRCEVVSSGEPASRNERESHMNGDVPTAHLSGICTEVFGLNSKYPRETVLLRGSSRRGNCLLPIILKLRIMTMAMSGWTASVAPVPLPTQSIATLVAGQAAQPVPVTLYDENDHQTGTVAIWRDGQTDDATKSDLKRMFRCRTTHRQKMLAQKTLAMLADISAHYAGRTVEYVSGLSHRPQRELDLAASRRPRDRLPHPRHLAAATSATTCGARTRTSASAGTRASSSCTSTRAPASTTRRGRSCTARITTIRSGPRSRAIPSSRHALRRAAGARNFAA